MSRDRRFEAALEGITAPGARRDISLDPKHIYTLAELVDIAERNNPETRASWERAKQQAAVVGIERSELFPTVAAVASASRSQYAFFMGRFYRENFATFPATAELTYTLLDLARGSRIDHAKAELLAADFEFNNTHRRIVFQVAAAYYQLLNATTQEDAARATLADARTVQEAVETRLANGLGTSPDVLEARAASAQAQYELASIKGLEEISRGGLATVLGVSPATEFAVEDVSKLLTPGAVGPIEVIMRRGIAQRPDLLAQVARIRSADADVEQARAAYYPVLSVFADWGHRNSYGSQLKAPWVSSQIYPYSAELNFNWTIFDGGARRNELARAKAERKEMEARATASRDQIEDEIWTSYTTLKTALAQQEAAEALLASARESYDAATEAFQSGVRTFIDVSSAQRQLARARSAQASARIEVLNGLADLAFRAADPIPMTGP
ncbi:MAG TPA: TolC family protein [Bryobacteraceae bacterium]